MQSNAEIFNSIKNFIETTSGLKVRERETEVSYSIQIGLIDPLVTNFPKDSFREDTGEEPEPEKYKLGTMLHLLEMYTTVLSADRESLEEWVNFTEQVN